MNGIVHDPSSGTGPDGPQVLLTGATGFLGAFLLDELLAKTGLTINCLVRGTDEEQARRRLIANLTHYHRWDEAIAERIAVTRGDLSLPLLGLAEDKFADLAQATGIIIHNGALVNYLFPISRMRAVNVQGTLSLVRLAVASARPTELHYISLAATDPVSAYGRSKLEAEEMVRESGLDGMPVNIYRITRLAPDSRTGLANKNDIVMRLLDIVLDIGAAPDIEFSENWIAVDVAARAIVETAIASRPGHTFSLNPREQTSFGYLLQVGRENGFGIEVEPLARWTRHVRAIASPEYELTIRALGFDDGPFVEQTADPEGGGDLVISVLDVPGVGRSVLDHYFARCRAQGRAAPREPSRAAHPTRAKAR